MSRLKATRLHFLCECNIHVKKNVPMHGGAILCLRWTSEFHIIYMLLNLQHAVAQRAHRECDITVSMWLPLGDKLWKLNEFNVLSVTTMCQQQEKKDNLSQWWDTGRCRPFFGDETHVYLLSVISPTTLTPSLTSKSSKRLCVCMCKAVKHQFTGTREQYIQIFCSCFCSRWVCAWPEHIPL